MTDPDFLISEKLLKDIALHSTLKETKHKSLFPFLSLAIRELISAEREGNLCIALQDSHSNIEENFSSEPNPSEFQSSIPKSKIQKELDHLPKGSFILQDCNFYFQKTFETKTTLETCFQILIQYTKEYRKQNTSRYSEERINQILEEIEKDWNPARKKQDRKNPNDFEKNLNASDFQKQTHERFSLNEDQRRAILQAIHSPFHIITGGPGTGKTTVVAFLMEVLYRLGELPPLEDIALAAPTGRAGQRLTESIQENWNCLHSEIPYREGIKATTVHRLLRFQNHTQSFYYNRERSFLYRFILIDEVSMVDLYLFRSLLLALPDLTQALDSDGKLSSDTPGSFRLILLGDPNQLPPVGKGAVFTDILAEIQSTLSTDPELSSMLLTHLRISNRFQGESGKKILELANFVIGKECHSNLEEFWLDLKPDSHRSHLAEKDFQIRDASCGYLWEKVFKPQLESILKSNLSTKEGILPDKTDFQRWNQETKCITFYKRGAFGIEGLQSLLDRSVQRFLKHFCPSEILKSEISLAQIDNKLYYPGLPLLITRNDSIRKLYNGDTGFVLWVGGELRACFLIDGEIRTFALDTLPSHEKAYFLTVHKSQGSEYETLYFYIPPPERTPRSQESKKASIHSFQEEGNRKSKLDEDPDPIFATRQILYTGITRAKSVLKFLGSREGWDEALKNESKRRTGFFLDLQNLKRS